MDISKLTDEEIAWYAERDWTLEILGNYSCGLCQYRDTDDLLCIFRECPKFKDDYKDAAEFEAKVNVILANGVESCEHCPAIGWCDFPACEESRLKFARLAVEAEMEKNNEKQSA